MLILCCVFLSMLVVKMYANAWLNFPPMKGADLVILLFAIGAALVATSKEDKP